MGEAPLSRYDYEIPLDYDPSGTTSRNLLEYFQNILLLTNRPNIVSRTSRMTPYTLLTDFCCELCSRSAAIPDAVPTTACDYDKYFTLSSTDYK